MKVGLRFAVTSLLLVAFAVDCTCMQKSWGTGALAGAGVGAIGSEQYNLKLSLRRATAVKQYLVKDGVPDTRLSVRGFGKTQPVASNDTADGRAQNRRVELKIVE